MQSPPSPVPGQVEAVHPLLRISIGPHRLSYHHNDLDLLCRAAFHPGLAQPWEMQESSPSTGHFITEGELSGLGVCFPHGVTEAPLSPLEERKEITQPSPSTLCFYKCSTGDFPIPCIHLYPTFPEAPPAWPSSGAAEVRRCFRSSCTRRNQCYPLHPIAPRSSASAVLG